MPKNNAFGVHLVDISAIKFSAQQKYRANRPFLDEHYFASGKYVIEIFFNSRRLNSRV
jgi:hypothetical protein